MHWTLFIHTGAGAYSGCAYCCQRGEHCKALSKMVYLQHRRFLPPGDPLHLDINQFPHKEVCAEDAPNAKTQKFVNDANDEYKTKTTAKARTEHAQTTGCTGSYALRSLTYHDRYLNTPVEPMHLIKCISEHIVKLISGAEDSVKVRSEEKNRMRFTSSWPMEVQVGSATKIILPPAPFRLSKSEMKIANQRALNIRTPHSVDWKAQMIFSEKIHMKSIHWKHVIASGILKYCIRDLLGSKQRKTVTELCEVLSQLVAEEVDMSHLDVLEYRTHRVLALLERDFPVSMNVIVFHLLHHLPMFLKRFGPAYSFWMYPLERFNSWIGRRVHNRRYPEATVIETYRLFEFTAFLSLAKLLPQDSIADIDSILDDKMLESDVHESDPETSRASCLNEVMFLSLKQFYQQSQQSGIDLDAGHEIASVNVPVNIITSCKFLVKVDRHGRHVRYSPYSPSLKHSSCIVYMHTPGSEQLVFGEIKSRFQHKFNGSTNSLVYVHWFDNFHKDIPSNLIYVNTNDSAEASLNPIAHITDLSKPLIHAYDGEEGKVWILNALFSL